MKYFDLNDNIIVAGGWAFDQIASLTYPFILGVDVINETIAFEYKIN